MTGSASRKTRPVGGELQKGSEGMVKKFCLLWLLLVLVFTAGCAAKKIPHTLVPDFGNRGMRLIAVMPVKNISADAKSGEMVRAKLVEALYFKGYPRIPLRLIDEKLAGVSAGGKLEVSPQAVGEMLKVDGILYPTLKESRMGSRVLYASTVVKAEFELRSTKTGEILWRVGHQEVYRNYGLSRSNVESKSSKIYEQAIEDVINRALETLPDCPDVGGN